MIKEKTRKFNSKIDISVCKDENGFARAFSFGEYKGKTGKSMENYRPSRTITIDELLQTATKVTTARTQRLAGKAQEIKEAGRNKARVIA